MAQSARNVIVIGLGYVGLPLAVELSKKHQCWGLDIDSGRVSELRSGHDRTGEVTSDTLAASNLHLTDSVDECPAADFIIVTVPTPVDERNEPDLSIMLAATNTVARLIKQPKKPIIVYESTVYPGVTEDICGPAIEQATGLKAGVDFFLGYSPERINPGDREHTVDRITKVVAGQDASTLDEIAALYETVTSGGVHRAASIKVAEAAKVIENAQRDINIAFVNEIAQIFGKVGISVWDVLDAANTKWNFLPFQPGLVGGHCIGVDPYYLSHLSTMLGKEPRVVLAGRHTNDSMAEWVAQQAVDQISPKSILVLGLTFKENVPDLRNSKVVDLIRVLQTHADVTVHDPQADASEAKHEYDLDLAADAMDQAYDLVLLAVPHQEYLADAEALPKLLTQEGRFFDLKRAMPSLQAALGPRYRTI